MLELNSHQLFVDSLVLKKTKNKSGHRTAVLSLRAEPDQVLWPESTLALAQLQRDQLSRSNEEGTRDTIKVQFVRQFPRAEYEFVIHEDDSFDERLADTLSMHADVKGNPVFKLVKGVLVGTWQIEAHLTPDEVGRVSQAVGSEYVLGTIKLAQQSLPLSALPDVAPTETKMAKAQTKVKERKAKAAQPDPVDDDTEPNDDDGGAPLSASSGRTARLARVKRAKDALATVEAVSEPVAPVPALH